MIKKTGPQNDRSVEVKSIEELRSWLESNHRTESGLWLIRYKKHMPDWYTDYSAVVDELLCFGWIDSLPRKLDADRSMLWIAPRKRGSAWSKINREKIARLESQNRLSIAGKQVVEQARQNGSWSKLEETDHLAVPDDLKEAFEEFPESEGHFSNFPPSARRAILEWILQAKTQSTRQKRIVETARLAALNQRANQWKKGPS
ncbi:MAG: YdeI/OmpD-associated family protein [Bacteroidetes bacterium]|nr:YdeI/OmpD-associated family protein [Bacteroidota bacterium]